MAEMEKHLSWSTIHGGGFDNMRYAADVTDRKAHDARLFREAGTSTKKTFSFDPTKLQKGNKK